MDLGNRAKQEARAEDVRERRVSAEEAFALILILKNGFGQIRSDLAGIDFQTP